MHFDQAESACIIRHILAYEAGSACFGLDSDDPDLDLRPLLGEGGTDTVREWILSDAQLEVDWDALAVECDLDPEDLTLGAFRDWMFTAEQDDLHGVQDGGDIPIDWDAGYTIVARLDA